jgi:hypothetical protein
MSMQELTLRRETFSAETTRGQGHELKVVMEGCADLRVQNEFGTLLNGIHQEARNQNSAQVIVNMEKLEFLNSGCFKSLCSWVRLLIMRQGHYKIHILSNSKHHWQARSLNALRLLAPDMVTVEAVQ